MATPYDQTLILLGQVLQKIFSITPQPYDSLQVLVGKVCTAMSITNTPYDKLEKMVLAIGAGLPNAVLANALAYLNPPPSPTSNPALTSLVAYWKMDEAVNGVRRDSHTGAHDLNLAGTVNSAAGQISNGASIPFNPANFLFSNEAIFSGATPFTAFAWVKFNGNLGSSQCVLGHYNAAALTNGWQIQQNGSSRLALVIGDGVGGTSALVHTAAISTGVFRLVIITIDDATHATIRVDNLSDISGVIVAPSNPVMPFRIGLTSNGSQPLDGVVDEVGIYNRILSSAEKDALWNAGAGKQYPFT